MSDPLTPEQIAVLARFADHYVAGHRIAVLLVRILAGLGALAMFIVTFLYFGTETLKNLAPK